VWLPAIGWQGVRGAVEGKIDAAFWFPAIKAAGGHPKSGFTVLRFLEPLSVGAALCGCEVKMQQRECGKGQGRGMPSRSGDQRIRCISTASAQVSFWPCIRFKLVTSKILYGMEFEGVTVLRANANAREGDQMRQGHALEWSIRH